MPGMAEPRTPRCPICGKPTAQPFRPFCSRRCADVDLHRWFSGAYRVETEEPPDPGEAEWTGKADPAITRPSRRGPR
jgi:endogenous inhibitor of DNA gyrase (YacG/DUF329 family)